MWEWENAIGTIRQTFDLVGVISDIYEKLSKKSRVQEFRDILIDKIQEKVDESVSAYVTDFGELERRLKDAPDEDAVRKVADDIAWRNERIWLVKATVESKARAWLQPMPEASAERTYLWAVLRIYYGRTIIVDKVRLQREADMVARQMSDEALDTPNTRVAERIRSGELISLEDLLETIRDEKRSVIARYRVARDLYEEIKVSATRQ